MSDVKALQSSMGIAIFRSSDKNDTVEIWWVWTVWHSDLFSDETTNTVRAIIRVACPKNDVLSKLQQTQKHLVFFKTQSHTMARGQGYLKSIEFIFEFLAIFLISVVFRTSVFDPKPPQNSKNWKIENSI